MSSESVIIVGCGYVGLPLAIKVAESGKSVIGFDIDAKKIDRLISGKTFTTEVSSADLLKWQSTGKLSFTSKLDKHSNPAIFVICVPTPLNSSGEPDLSMLIQACEIISNVICEGSLVVNESTSFIGTLNKLIKPMIHKISGVSNLDFAVAPERIDPGNSTWSLSNTPRIIAAVSDSSLARTREFYASFCKEILVVSSPEVAETAKLFENTFRHLNIALVNELSSITNAFGISTHEVVSAASTKPYGFMPFYPGVGVGGHCIPVDPSYLKYSAELFGVKTDLISLANKLNKSNVEKIVKRIEIFLGGDLKNKVIQMAGISYKTNVADLRESPYLELIEQIQKLGGKVSWYDPLVSEWNGQFSMELRTDIDLGIICSPHSVIDFSIWKDGKVKVLDLSATNKNYGWTKFL